MGNSERSTRDKLDASKSRLEKLNIRLKGILEQLNPLVSERDKLQKDIKYYEGRVEKLTARLKEVENG